MTLTARLMGAVTNEEERPMSIFAQALTLLPPVAALIVILVAIADRRDGASLRDICELHPSELAVDAEELETAA